MRTLPRLQDLNPLRLVKPSFAYERIPLSDGANGSPQWRAAAGKVGERFRCGGRLSMTRVLCLAIGSIVILALLAGGGYHVRKGKGGTGVQEEAQIFHWQHYFRLDGYYNGIRTLVPHSQWKAGNRYNQSEPPAHLTAEEIATLPTEPPVDPILYDPYVGNVAVETCYLDAEETIPAPDIFAYPGVPRNLEDPLYGSYKVLGLQEQMCFERFGRLGPYGYGYNESHGGGPGKLSETSGTEKIWKQAGFTNYSIVDWGEAQRRCYEKNRKHFEPDPKTGKKKQRQAYILRTWTGYKYGEHQFLSLRAQINELALKSGGEYDVHFLVHVKNNSIPIWADEATYNATLQEYVPREFWNIATLWSEKQMELYYPEPFPTNFANMAGSSIHGVYRSPHFALQWFAQQHPEYDFFWNWEMDVRYSGHYWEFNHKIGEWAKQQPRKGLWERSARFYIPHHHGDWQNFTTFVERETAEIAQSKPYPAGGPVPVWGPVQDFPNWGMLKPLNETIPTTSYEKDNYEWGVGEDADLLTFNPLFDPSLTNWVFSHDITGFDTTVDPPPRRAAIITLARMSRRLLDTMHKEVWHMRHTMFPEMWPPSVCFYHGLKAVYVPHPVFFDRDWDTNVMNEIFNYPKHVWEAVFGWGENNLLGSTFYYNAGFSGALWRRWLGQRENGEGGRAQEEAGTGRMCLRGTLHHPIKRENGPED